MCKFCGAVSPWVLASMSTGPMSLELYDED